MTRQEALTLVLIAATRNQKFSPYEYTGGEMDCVVDDILERGLFRKYRHWLEENGFISEVV